MAMLRKMLTENRDVCVNITHASYDAKWEVFNFRHPEGVGDCPQVYTVL